MPHVSSSPSPSAHARVLQADLPAATSSCAVCEQPLFNSGSGGGSAGRAPGPGPGPSTGSGPETLVLVFLCRHAVHATCALLNDDTELPERPENAAALRLLLADNAPGAAHLARHRAQQRALGSKLSYEAMVRVRVGPCPACAHARGQRAHRLGAHTGDRMPVRPARTVLA